MAHLLHGLRGLSCVVEGHVAEEVVHHMRVGDAVEDMVQEGAV